MTYAAKLRSTPKDPPAHPFAWEEVGEITYNTRNDGGREQAEGYNTAYVYSHPGSPRTHAELWPPEAREDSQEFGALSHYGVENFPSSNHAWPSYETYLSPVPPSSLSVGNGISEQQKNRQEKLSETPIPSASSHGYSAITTSPSESLYTTIETQQRTDRFRGKSSRIWDRGNSRSASKKEDAKPRTQSTKSRDWPPLPPMRDKVSRHPPSASTNAPEKSINAELGFGKQYVVNLTNTEGTEPLLQQWTLQPSSDEISNSTEPPGSYLLPLTTHSIQASDVPSPFVLLKVLRNDAKPVKIQGMFDTGMVQNLVSVSTAAQLGLIDRPARDTGSELQSDDEKPASYIGSCRLKWSFGEDTPIHSETFLIVDTQDHYDLILGKAFVEKTSTVGKLGPGYERIGRPKTWFTIGRVFMMLWSEPLGNNETGSFSEIRRFVVAQTYSRHCLCHPIMTYGGRGTLKPGTAAEGHAPVIAVDGKPQYHKEENQAALKKPLRIKIQDPYLRDLDPFSRVNYWKVYTIEYNSPVRNIGRVITSSLDDLQKNSVVASMLTNSANENQSVALAAC